MAMTGAERVRKHRQKQKDAYDDLESRLEELRGLYAVQMDNHHRLVDAVEQIDNLKRRNKAVWTMYAKIRDEHAECSGLEDFLSEDSAGLSPEHWDTLTSMSGDDLVKWAKIGRAMASKGHDSPIDNAVRWVRDNKPVEAIG